MSLNIDCSPVVSNGSPRKTGHHEASMIDNTENKIQNIEPQSPEFLTRGDHNINQPCDIVASKLSGIGYRYMPVQPTYNQDQPLDLTLQKPKSCGYSPQTVRSSKYSFDQAQSNSPLDLTMPEAMSYVSVDRLADSNTTCQMQLHENVTCCGIDSQQEAVVLDLNTKQYGFNNLNTMQETSRKHDKILNIPEQ